MNDKLFDESYELSFAQFVEGAGRCFYVPPYQRYYVWKRKDIERFFQDSLEGLRSFTEGSKKVTFLGTMTCFHDVRFETIEPKVRQDVPDSVLNVVDGQQRLTTLMICSVLLHNYIRATSQQCNSTWLRKRVAASRLLELQRTFEIQKSSGEAPYYPKMIRAFDDQWSIDPSKCRYISPLSHLIASYGSFARRNNVESYTHRCTVAREQLTSEQHKTHAIFDKLVGKTSRIITDACSGKEIQVSYDSTLSMPHIEEFIENEDVAMSIFNLDALPTDEDIDLTDNLQQKLIRALFLSSYILKNIHFVALISPSDHQAFEIFESLNTTGQTLTALETFKPEVITFEGIQQYLDSLSKNYYDDIDRYINTLSTPESQKQVSGEIVINFALAESGARLSNHLSTQRNYLREHFGMAKQKGKLAAQDYLRHLQCVSHVTQHFWEQTADGIRRLNQYSDLSEDNRAKLPAVQLCLKYLKASRHSICRSLLARFHHAVLSCSDEKVQANISELFEVIMATAAFFAIWRSTRQGTERLDDCHRELLRVGVKPEEPLCPELHRQAGKQLSSLAVKRAFCHMLANNEKGSKLKIRNLADYMQAVYQVPIYRTHNTTSKLLLILAAHNAVPSRRKLGQFEDGREGYQPMLSGDIWDDSNYETVEHIIPQSTAGGDALMAEKLHRLGNLTLLPKKFNSLVGDLSWDQRKILYSMISTDRKSDVNKIQVESSSNISDEQVQYMRSISATPMVKPLLGIEKFVERSIQPRSDNLAERAWKILFQRWLKTP